MLQRVGRVVMKAITAMMALLVLALAIVYLLSNTDWGRERIRRFTVRQIQSRIHGKAFIGKLTGNLIFGVTVHDLAIRDTAGDPFLVADALSFDYRLLSLVRKRLYFDDVRAERLLVVLDRRPEGTWNFKRIFARDTLAPVGPNAWLQHIRLTDASVEDAHVVVRSPWRPDEDLSPAERAASVREALAGRTRLRVIAVRGGYQKIVEMRHIHSTAPVVRIADPAFRYQLARLTSLRGTVLFFRPPAAELRSGQGELRFTGDSIWWHHAFVSMPASRVSGSGVYEFTDGDMTLTLRGAPVALADMRWIYPRLPSRGSGTLDFLLRWDGTTESYFARNADIRSGITRVRGDFGITANEEWSLHDTHLRIANLETRMIEQLVRGFRSPRRGTLGGTFSLAGGRDAMRLNGDLTFVDRADGISRVAAAGVLGFGNGVRVSGLRVRMAPLQVELARGFLRDAPISGVITGTALVNGSTRTRMAVSGDIRHEDRGAVSLLTGRAAIRLAGRTYVEADVTARPLSLAVVGRFAPSLGLVGRVAGSIHLAGSPGDMRFRVDLRLPRGTIAARGSLGLAGRNTRYDLSAVMRALDLRSVMASAPTTSLSARLIASGRGFDPATMRATFAADLGPSSWKGVSVERGSVRATIAGGMATVDRLHASGHGALIEAAGRFGLRPDRRGELTYRLAVDSLGAFAEWIPGGGADTGMVYPRPARMREAIARARADSLRRARATEVQRAISGAPPPRLRVDTPMSVGRAALRGSLYAAGTVRGNPTRFDLRGRATGDSILARGSFVRRFRAEYAWTDARTRRAVLAVGVQADTVSVAGFGFDSLDARIGYRAPEGHVEIVVRQGEARDYALTGDVLLEAGRRQFRVVDLTLRFDTTRWRNTRPAVIDWSGNRIVVHTLELKDGAAGRLYVNGVIPESGPIDLQVAVESFELMHLAELLQSDVEVSGIVSVAGRMRGTRAAPEFRGAYGAVGGVYRGTSIPQLRGTFAYAHRVLATHLDALRMGGEPLLVADGRLPLDLALTGVTGSRVLDEPMTIDITADSMPLELAPLFTDALSGGGGLAVGRVSVRGTPRRPSIIGGLAFARGSVTIAATGMRIDNIGGTVRMLNDSIYVDSLAGTSIGDVHLRGAVDLRDWSTPSFNLYLVARDAQVLHNEHGSLRADAGLALSGSFDRPYLSGQITVTKGVVYLPTPTSRNVINAGDPALFLVVDTTVAGERELFPTPTPFFRNARVDVTIAVNRNTWVRSREMNIEVYTEYPVSVRSRGGDLALIGTITTDRGEYSFLSKRFQISRGSATFVGGPEINPALQVTGEYRVQLATAPAMTIRVLIGGTLRRPRLSLESDVQPPRSQSELLTLLAFGRATTNLLQPEGNSFTGAIGPGDLVGIGASVAVRRLAGIALGVAVQELEAEAGRGLGADVFDITPGDIPWNFTGPRSFSTFLEDTRLEIGKYVNTRTFLALQGQGQVFGGRLQYRTADGWLYQTYWEPRYLLREPSLSGQTTIPTTAFGALVLRAWRF